jgi:dihydrofolate reductase
VVCFGEAVKLDPKFAVAWAWLARVSALGYYVANVPPRARARVAVAETINMTLAWDSSASAAARPIVASCHTAVSKLRAEDDTCAVPHPAVAYLFLVRRMNPTLPDIVYYVASSLDSYIATADAGVDWLTRFQTAGEDYGAGELQTSVDALLLGSHTYEFALKLGQWPSPGKPSWVFTHRDLRVLHPSITLTSDTPAAVVGLLRSRGIRRAWLMGGGQLAASFHSAGLISRYIISIFPVLIGSGIPLFAPNSSRENSLRFVEAKLFAGGIVQLTYDRVSNA